MIHSRYLWSCIALAWFAVGAIAQDSLPTDSELHTAYCIPVLQWQIQWYREIFGAQTANLANGAQTPELKQHASKLSDQTRKLIADLESALNRLQLYLLPRIEHRDSFALVAAQKRGESDVQEFKGLPDRCGTECGVPLGASANDTQQACLASCANKDVVLRMKACATPTWLPF
jgi:hypothetical protein